MKKTSLICIILVAIMLFAMACSSSDSANESKDSDDSPKETESVEKEEKDSQENSKPEFEPWQNQYTYYGTPLDGIVKIFDYYLKSQQEINPYDIAPENEEYAHVYAFYISVFGMNLNEI